MIEVFSSVAVCRPQTVINAVQSADCLLRTEKPSVMRRAYLRAAEVLHGLCRVAVPVE